MENKTGDKTVENKTGTEKIITISINGKEVNRISLADAIRRKRTIKDIVMVEINKSPEIKAVAQFFVHVNGKNVLPKDTRHISIGNVKTIEIFDGVSTNSTEK